MQRKLPGIARSSGWTLILMILILIECGFCFYFRNDILPKTVSELGFTLTSVLIGLLLLGRYYGRTLVYVSRGPIARNRTLSAATWLLLGTGIVAAGFSLAHIFKEIPIRPENSDIIPLIRSGVERMLHGEPVYAPVSMIVYDLPQTYLPMQWMPFTIAELLHFDYRWIAAGIFFIAAFFSVWRANRVSEPDGMRSTILLICFTWMMLVYDHGIPGMSVEPMVAGYYMLLIVGLSNRNPRLRGAAIALCLLSRYSLVLWLPLWAFVEFVSGNRKDLLRSCSVIAALVLLIYVIPFLSHDWSTFSQGYRYYTKAAEASWNTPQQNGIPFVLDLGIGLAREFYLYLPGHTVNERLHILQKTHIIVCLGSVALMSIWYWFKRKKIHPRIFLLASFKIYLGLFLAFIQVPFPYLMITAVTVSIAIFAELPRWKVS